MEDLKQRKKNLIMFPLGTVGRDNILPVHKLHHNLCSVHSQPHERAIRRDNGHRRRSADI